MKTMKTKSRRKEVLSDPKAPITPEYPNRSSDDSKPPEGSC